MTGRSRSTVPMMFRGDIIRYWMVAHLGNFLFSLFLSSFSGRTNRVRSLPRPDWIDKLPGNQGRKEDRDLSLGSNPKLELALSSLFSTPFCRMDCWLAISSKRGLCRATQPLYRTEENNFFLSLFFCSLWFFLFPVPWMNKVSLISTTPRGKNLRTFSPSGVLYLP